MDRRKFLQHFAGASALLALAPKALAQAGKAFSEAALAPMRALGLPLTPISQRAASEAHIVRYISDTLSSRHTGAAFSPLESFTGLITPSDLHFERHHGGVPTVDPNEYRLLIHGMVKTPLMFTLEAIKRYPSFNQIMFIECAGNGQNGFSRTPDENMTATRSKGLVSNSEWTGTPLKLLLEEAVLDANAKWLVIEGMDAAAYTRSIPLDKALESCFVAYGQNGEALRPQQGYPIRLIVPGWEGSTHIKWVRRIEVSDTPYMTRDETSHYTDPNPDGTSSFFTWEMLAQSIITSPSGTQQLQEKGFYEIRGVAWSGAGKVTAVEVSVDGGESWVEARLEPPVLSLAMVRFTLPWQWDGQETVLLSRAIDEKGYVQPSRAEVIKAWGYTHRYHYNGMQAWKVLADGKVVNGDEVL